MKRSFDVKKFVPYEVDFSYLNDDVVFFVSSDDKEKRKIDFHEIIQFFSDQNITDVAEFASSLDIDCDGIVYTIECENFLAQEILSVLLHLQKDKKPTDCIWYLYDYSSCNEMPQFIHYFFLTHENQIIFDAARIATSYMDDCDPNILIEISIVRIDNSSLPLWDNMEGDLKATALWFYEKFYKETDRGQILAIRENLETLSPARKSSKISSGLSKVLLTEINKKLGWSLMLLGVIVLKMFF